MDVAAKGTDNGGQVCELTLEEGRRLLEWQVRQYLDMGVEEFIRRWEAGEFEDELEYPEVTRLAMLIPFGR